MIEILIPDQGHELIRDRTAEILMCEFKNQVEKYDNYHCKDVKFFAERITPLGQTESPIINLGLWKGDYGNKNSDYVDGTYNYVIDIVSNGIAKGKERGDTRAAYRVQKLMGIVRYILEHSLYETLSFDRPFILHTELSKFQMMKYDTDEQPDSGNVRNAQAVFTVRCGEETTPGPGVPVAGNDTSVTLETTDLGYEYVFNT